MFLIIRDLYNLALVDIIAGWIKKIIQRSDPSSIAKDVRSTSASLVQNARMGISIVLALGNWSSNSTFQKFYQHKVSLMLEKSKIFEMILNESLNDDLQE